MTFTSRFTRYLALPTLALATALTVGAGSASAAPQLAGCTAPTAKPGQPKPALPANCLNPVAVKLPVGSGGVAQAGPAATGGSGQTGPAANPPKPTPPAGNAGGVNVNGSGNAVVGINGNNNTVNNSNTNVTNVTQVSNNTTLVVPEPAAAPQIVTKTLPPAPAPAPETVLVTTDMGLSIDKDLGGQYVVGDLLGVTFATSREMDVELALVIPNGRFPIYSGKVAGSSSMTTVVPNLQGIVLLELKGTAPDGTTATRLLWFQVSPPA